MERGVGVTWTTLMSRRGSQPPRRVIPVLAQPKTGTPTHLILVGAHGVAATAPRGDAGAGGPGLRLAAKPG